MSSPTARRWLPDSWLLVIVLLTAAAFRLLVYMDVSTADPVLTPSYPHSLREHFGEYLWYTSLQPPLTYLLHAIPVWILGPDGNTSWRGFLLLNAFCGVSATGLLFAAFRRSSVAPTLAVVLALMLSVALVPHEVWRSNYSTDHHDHFPPVLMALFLWRLVVMLQQGLNRRTGATLGFAGMLLVLQLPAASYVIPVTVAAAVVIEWLRHRTTAIWQGAALLLGLPAAGIALLVVHNFQATGVPAPGTKGGAAIMMFVQSALDDKPDAVRALVVESGAPEWYLWCYDRPQITPLPPGSNPAAYLALAQAFGNCSPLSGPVGQAGTPWPFDFAPLQTQLAAMGETRLAGVVAQDQFDAINRQYLLQGGSPELSARWIAAYGQESQRVALHLARSRPDVYWAALRRHHRDLFYGRGPEFLARTADDLRTDSYRFRLQLFFYCRFIFPAVLRSAYLVLPIATLAAVIASLWRSRRLAIDGMSPRLYLLLLIMVAPLVILYSGAVSVENDRYFVHLLAPLMLAFGLLVKDLTGAIAKVFPTNA